MAKQFTGIDGSLYLDGNKVAKVTEWSFAGAVDTLECTTLGDFARKYVYGVQGYSGSCTLLYYEANAGAIVGGDMLTDVIRTTQTPTEPTHNLQLRYENGAKLHAVSFDCLIQQVSIAAQVGGIVTASVNFTVNGPLKSATIG